MSFKTALVGASALVVAASFVAMPAQAQSPAPNALFGGGGTLAAKLYRDVFNCYSSTSYGIYASSPGNPANVTYPAGLNAACTTSYGASEALDYEPVGSGAGLSAFTTGMAANFGMPASTNTVAYLNSAFNVGASAAPYLEVNFAGSDAYLTADQITAASAIDAPSGSSAAIFQIPTLATPITLPVGDVTGVSLSGKQVCDVFSGQIKLPNNTATTQQIFVRADGSGTSAIFGLWLSQNCIGKGQQGKTYAFTSGNGFGSTAPTWSAALVGTLGTITAVTGSGGIAAAVISSSFSIGYVSPDYVHPVVNNKAYPVSIAGLQPTVANTNSHIAAIAIPSTYDNNIGFELNNESTSPSIASKGYPIAGFTFIDTYGCYSKTYDGGMIGSLVDGNRLKSFLNIFFNNSSFGPQATKILNASGFVNTPLALRQLYSSAGGPLSSTGINGTQCPAGRT